MCVCVKVCVCVCACVRACVRVCSLNLWSSARRFGRAYKVVYEWRGTKRCAVERPRKQDVLIANWKHESKLWWVLACVRACVSKQVGICVRPVWCEMCEWGCLCVYHALMSIGRAYFADMIRQRVVYDSNYEAFMSVGWAYFAGIDSPACGSIVRSIYVYGVGLFYAHGWPSAFITQCLWGGLILQTWVHQHDAFAYVLLIIGEGKSAASACKDKKK